MVGWNHEGSIRKGQKCCKKEPWWLCHNLPPGICQHNTDKALYGMSTNQKSERERGKELPHWAKACGNCPANSLWAQTQTMKFHKNRHLIGKDQTFQKLNGLAPNTISIDHVYFFLLTLFVNRYEEQGKFRRQVKAQNLWQAICQSQIETGTPYMLYKDACNRKSNQQVLKWVDPLHPNISMHSLHTVLYTFPKVLTKKICLTIKNFFSLRSVPLFAWP